MGFEAVHHGCQEMPGAHRDGRDAEVEEQRGGVGLLAHVEAALYASQVFLQRGVHGVRD